MTSGEVTSGLRKVSIGRDRAATATCCLVSSHAVSSCPANSGGMKNKGINKEEMLRTYHCSQPKLIITAFFSFTDLKSESYTDCARTKSN